MPTMSYRDAIRAALREEMQRDERVFIMGEEVGVWGGSYAVTRGLLDEFGEKRVKDTPISETAIVGAAIGSAMAGLRPVAELMTINFALVAMDQIVNEAAKLHYMFNGQIKVPLVIRTVGGGGRQLAATHSQSLEGVFAYFPGLKVVLPATPADAKGLLKASIRDENPVMFIEHSLLYGLRGEVPDGEHLEPIGVAKVIRPGRDVTIVTYSRMLHISLEAANDLARDGIEAEVIDLRTLQPLDMDTVLKSFRKNYRAVVVTEDWPAFGASAELATRLYEEGFDYLDAPIKRVTSAEVPVAYAKNLESAAMPDKGAVVRAVRELVRPRERQVA